MKKGKIVKFSAATMVALSAITPVAAFASEAGTQDGFYTGNKFVPAAEFQKMSKSEKKALILENIKANALVLVQNGKVFDLTDEKIANAPANEVEGITVEQYTAETGKTLTQNGIVDGSTELTVTSVSAINPTSVKVTFNKEVEALAKADVTVTNKENNKVLVKSVTLAEDKKSATIEFYDALTKGEYKVAVKDAGEATLTYTVGVPTTIVAETVQKFSTGKTDKVAYKVLDENGLDITATVKDVKFETTNDAIVDATGEVKNVDSAGSAFVYVVVTKEDGKELKSQRITVNVESVKVVEIVDYTVDSEATKTNVNFKAATYKQNTKVPAKGATVYLHAQTKDQFGKVGETASTTAKFESLDLDVAVVDATTGKITPIKEGKFAVKITDGSISKTVELEVVAEAKATTIELDKAEVTLSNKSTNAEKVKVEVKDQFGNKMSGQVVNAAATTNAGKDLVNVSYLNGEVSISPKANVKAGTATIEVKVSDTVKTTFVVTVTEAGTVEDYKLVGFESKLDKNEDNKAKTPVKATLSVIPVDSQGAQAGDAVVAPTFTVTDKDNEVVANAVTDNEIVASNLDAGTYTLTVKVGTVKVATETFEVVDTTPQPELEFTATTVSNSDDDDAFTEVAAKLKATLADKEYTVGGSNALTVNNISYTTTNSAIVDSAEASETISFAKDGSVDLLIGKVAITIGGKDYTVDMKNFKLTVSSNTEANTLQSTILNKITDLENVTGTGTDAAITADDVKELIENTVLEPANGATPAVNIKDKATITVEAGTGDDEGKWIVSVKVTNATEVKTKTISATPGA
ncbi:hypothetical protein [Lysinibacillus boronitolerans]|uniref:BIG2 domain-containing protein n=1 Tax=Lysinibacillus boronitolerans JCM 21713 = 10a = NBRC 103108 TaxID=1294264 RepID=A0ABR4Y4K0_9BACI|nr:hypothetical protein [Lysinibacillus boronitolerans]KGR88040.1 hypothetical protein CD31_05105 [Lysinibacillus boronitolerans JCM 21713 = 10a = NBRC 103108]